MKVGKGSGKNPRGAVIVCGMEVGTTCTHTAEGQWTLVPCAQDLAEGPSGSSLASAVPEEARGLVEVSLGAEIKLAAISVAVLRLTVDRLTKRGLKVRIRAANAEQRRLIKLFGAEPEATLESPRPRGLERLLQGVHEIKNAAIECAWLLSRTLGQSVVHTLRPRARDDQRLLGEVAAMGMGAVPLIALIASMLGMILALQAAPILRMWGQELRVADLVGLSMTKEIGPLLTAILLAGRSGSALAAELGTMKLNDEIDAMTVMGVDPIATLVTPRMRAMLLALPLLTLMGDVLGICGGLVIASVVLDVAVIQYIHQTLQEVHLADIMHGLVKSALFAMVIVTTAAWQGLSTKGGAAGIGRHTTRSVVYSILWIIVVDATYTWIETVINLR